MSKGNGPHLTLHSLTETREVVNPIEAIFGADSSGDFVIRARQNKTTMASPFRIPRTSPTLLSHTKIHTIYTASIDATRLAYDPATADERYSLMQRSDIGGLLAILHHGCLQVPPPPPSPDETCHSGKSCT